MNTSGMLVAPVNVVPIKDSLIVRNRTTVVRPEASYACASSGSTKSAVGDALVGISFGYARPLNA